MKHELSALPAGFIMPEHLRRGVSHTVAPIDFSALLELLGGKREVAASLLDKFLTELATDIDAARRAVATQDTEALRQIAHRIKGTSANLHATMLSASARELESACAEADPRLVTLKHDVMCDQSQRLIDAIKCWRDYPDISE